MAVRLSALRAGRPLPSGKILVLISVRGSVQIGKNKQQAPLYLLPAGFSYQITPRHIPYSLY
jgi:hypothetical protein